jgi:hypothetical protein
MDSIKSFIDQVHNPKLVQPEESPNGNIIYHLYCDGTITFQKGGWAYLDRSEFTDSRVILKKNFNDIFPIKRDDTSSYAIVTEKNAKTIRNMMVEFDKK